MVNCERFVNSRFTSNTYIIYHTDYDNVWVVDPGDTEVVFEWMHAHSKTTISGILLTHAHFDHIYGMNDILSRYSQCAVYVSNDYGKELLNDPKKNGSKYTEEGPIVIADNSWIFSYEEIMYLWEDVSIHTYYTPSHSDDSMCFLLEDKLFTGDTLIKDVRTVTKLKTGSVDKLQETVGFIQKLQGNGIKIFPGHGDVFELDGYELDKMTRGKEYT